jgi:hypothetical protein
MADNERIVKFERVEDVLNQLERLLANMAGSIGGGVREPMTRKVDRQQPVTRKGSEKGGSRCGTQRNPVQ